jgi:pimeloyl-ACP methyl ester carboxylesterase
MTVARRRVIGACAALLAACARAPVRPSEPAAGLSPPVEASQAEARAALEALVARGEAVRTVSGEAKLVLVSPGGGGKVTALVAARRPSEARVDLVTLLGPLKAAAFDAASFRVVDFADRRAMDAPSDASAWARLTGLRIEPRLLVSLLCGVVPVDASTIPNALETSGERAVLGLAAFGETWAVELETATGRPLVLATPDWTARFEQYAGAPELPGRVRIEADGGRRSLELRWKEREVNGPLDERRLRLPVPDGFRTERFPFEP